MGSAKATTHEGGCTCRAVRYRMTSEGQKIARCPKCRVALWSNYGGAGDVVRFVRVGTLDQPDRLPPDIHIFTASKQPWVVLAAGVPTMGLPTSNFRR